MKTASLTLAVILFTAIGIGAADDPAVESAAENQPTTEVVKSSAALPTGAGIWIGVGPGNAILPSGVYRFIFLPTDTSKQVEVTTIDTAGGPGVPPPPPPVEDVRAVFANALVGVDAVTAGSLSQVFAELVKGANDAKVTQAQLTSGATTITTLVTTGKPTWAKFTSALSVQLGKATTLAGAASVLQIAVEELAKVK